MLNRVTLMGRLTHDPELRQTQGSDPKAVVRFGLAVDRDYKNKDGNKITDFFDVVAWRKKAEFISKYFKKGQLVYIEGRLQRDVWEDENNQKKTAYKIIAENCYFADSKKVSGEQNINQTDHADETTQKSNNYFDDLPF